MNGFSIYHIFRLLVKNLFIIILCAILCGVGAFCYCEFQLQERYAASGSIVVTNGGIFDTNTNTNHSITQATALMVVIFRLLSAFWKLLRIFLKPTIFTNN